MASRREFHLVQDFIAGGAGATGAAATRPRQSPLVVPGGICYLTRGAEGLLRIATTPAKESEPQQLILEPTWICRQPQLLLIHLGDDPVFVNGRVAPQLCVLGEGDQFQPNDTHVLHVLVFYRPDIGPPSDESVGNTCPICRTQIEAGMRVYACLSCGTVMHLHGEETPPERRLECALTVQECASCRAKIELSEGYGWEPEL